MSGSNVDTEPSVFHQTQELTMLTLVAQLFRKCTDILDMKNQLPHELRLLYHRSSLCYPNESEQQCNFTELEYLFAGEIKKWTLPVLKPLIVSAQFVVLVPVLPSLLEWGKLISAQVSKMLEGEKTKDATMHCQSSCFVVHVRTIVRIHAVPGTHGVVGTAGQGRAAHVTRVHLARGRGLREHRLIHQQLQQLPEQQCWQRR